MRHPSKVVVLAALALGAGRGASAGDMCGAGHGITGGAFEGPSANEIKTGTPAQCCAACEVDPSCLAWNQKMPSTNCFLYHTVPTLSRNITKQRSTTGTRRPAPSPTPPPPPPPPPPPTQPVPAKAMNVLMIAIDDMRPELSPYGSSHMHTPNIEALANRSMLFTRAYVQVRDIWARFPPL